MTGKELAIPERVIEGKVLGVPYLLCGCDPAGDCPNEPIYVTAEIRARWRKAREAYQDVVVEQDELRYAQHRDRWYSANPFAGTYWWKTTTWS